MEFTHSQRVLILSFLTAVSGTPAIAYFQQPGTTIASTTLPSVPAASDGEISARAEVTPSTVITRPLVTESIRVLAATRVSPAQPDDFITIAIPAAQVRSTAGAFSDIPRFLQTLPGIMFDTDSRNTYFVNGGNPLENLYVVDGVEVPNINHISSANTSGGFVSMIDTDAVADIRLHKMLYSSEYSGTLSSVLEIRTRDVEQLGLHGDVSVGYAGVDLVLNRHVAQRGQMLIEVRKSLVNYFTDDIGIGGVPKYQSTLSTETFSLGEDDTLSTLYLQGTDELAIRPNLLDSQDPGFVNTLYSGNRVTVAGTWMHRSGEARNARLQFSFSRVRSTTLQTNAMAEESLVESNSLLDQPAALRYDYTANTSHLGLHAGLLGTLHGVNYRIEQPNGFASPYRVDATPLDASNIYRSLLPVDAGGYIDLSYHGPHGMELSGGGRLQRWGINAGESFSPRLSVRSPSVLGTYLYGGVARYSQLAPLPTMLGIASNQALRPISDLQMQAGAVLKQTNDGWISLSVYRKLYRDYPVSTEYPTLSLADVVDPFGQPFLYLPMTSAGTGTASGVELEYAGNPHRRAFMRANISHQTVTHRALDGISRRANFDMPILANLIGSLRLGQRQRLSGRFSYHTGTPYTPFLLTQSQQQSRPIFDLSKINTQRGSDYARLDLRYEVEVPVARRNLAVYIGLNNVLGRNNFYQYVFIPHCHSLCEPYELTQQGQLAEGGLTYRF